METRWFGKIHRNVPLGLSYTRILYIEFERYVTSKSLCDAAINGPDKAIVDTLVFTHSLGNLIFARGLDLGVCLGNSSKWVSMSAPWKGSKAAELVSDMCLKGSIFDKAMKKIR